MHNFAAYMDVVILLHPRLVLVGGPYQFQLTKSNDVHFQTVACLRPYMGVSREMQGVPYLFLLLNLESEIEVSAQPELRIASSERTIYWRMVGNRIFRCDQLDAAQRSLREYPPEIQTELEALATQYATYFPQSEGAEVLTRLISG